MTMSFQFLETRSTLSDYQPDGLSESNDNNNLHNNSLRCSMHAYLVNESAMIASLKTGE